MWRSLFWIFLIVAVAVGTAAIIGCGDDDDDDDNDDNDDGDDDDDDDDDFNSTDGSVMGICIEYYLNCFQFTAEMAEEVCQELLDLEQSCSEGATQRLFECTGSDCDKWEECSAVWEDEINC